jgi:hypothetical protein
MLLEVVEVEEVSSRQELFIVQVLQVDHQALTLQVVVGQVVLLILLVVLLELEQLELMVIVEFVDLVEVVEVLLLVQVDLGELEAMEEFLVEVEVVLVIL